MPRWIHWLLSPDSHCIRESMMVAEGAGLGKCGSWHPPQWLPRAKPIRTAKVLDMSDKMELGRCHCDCWWPKAPFRHFAARWPAIGPVRPRSTQSGRLGNTRDMHVDSHKRRIHAELRKASHGVLV